MTLSIKQKLYILLISLMILFITSTLLFAYLGFSKFYMQQKKEKLAELGATIESIYNSKTIGNFKAIDEISEQLGITITLINLHENFAYTAKPQKDSYSNLNNLSSYIDEFNKLLTSKEKIKEQFDAKTSFTEMHTQDNKVKALVMIRHLDSSEFLLIRQPLAPIEESIIISQTFITLSGLISLSIGFIFIFFYTKRLSKPFTTLTNLAKDMSKLDFSKQWEGQGSDEINILGNTLNQLSNSLEESMKNLHDTNEELEKELKKVQSLDKMRKSFISNVSHELKTPLSLIQGYAEGLSLPSIIKDNNMRNHYTSIIIDETQKMDMLVKDLLNLSRIESGTLVLNQERFDLNELLHTLILAFSQTLNEKNIRIIQNMPHMYYAYGDSNRLNQVFTNLLSNAVDYTDPNKCIEISGEEFPDYYRITIINEGITILEDEIDLIWSSFHKIDKARTRKFGGHGLGLSIVKALQDLHGQKCGIYNTPSGVAAWATVKKYTPEN